MLVYKKNGDGYIVLQAEYDNDDQVILDKDMTIEPPPEVGDKEDVTIEDGQWVIYERETIPMTLNQARYLKLSHYERWNEPYIARPFIFEGHVYENDSRFKEMMNSVVSAMQVWGKLPKLWITANKEVITPITEEFVNGLGITAYEAQEESIGLSIMILGRIKAATTVEEINAITLPFIDDIESRLQEIEDAKKEDEGEEEVAQPDPGPVDPEEGDDSDTEEPVVEPETK